MLPGFATKMNNFFLLNKKEKLFLLEFLQRASMELLLLQTVVRTLPWSRHGWAVAILWGHIGQLLQCLVFKKNHQIPRKNSKCIYDKPLRQSHDGGGRWARQKCQLHRPSLLIGFVHCIFLCSSTLSKLFPWFNVFMSLQSRGLVLSNCEKIRQVHNSFARPTFYELDLNLPPSEDNYHFITFVPVGNKVRIYKRRFCRGFADILSPVPGFSVSFCVVVHFVLLSQVFRIFRNCPAVLLSF